MFVQTLWATGSFAAFTFCEQHNLFHQYRPRGSNSPTIDNYLSRMVARSPEAHYLSRVFVLNETRPRSGERKRVVLPTIHGQGAGSSFRKSPSIDALELSCGGSGVVLVLC
mmetsp:Transcript_25709/g.59721  ORF Transcript_25709/g.59721 Transcript_25709/m.59721 type:complete len:111 (+) Transcript_25709:731-1063(+)